MATLWVPVVPPEPDEPPDPDKPPDPEGPPEPEEPVPPPEPELPLLPAEVKKAPIQVSLCSGVIVHPPEPVHAPSHSERTDPTDGVAVNVTDWLTGSRKSQVPLLQACP